MSLLAPNPYNQRAKIPLATQLDFMWHELSGPEKAAMAAMTQPRFSAADYATAFDQTYERSGGAGDDRARAYADQVYAALGEDPTADVDLPPNAKFVYNYALQKGLDPKAAAGLTGRLMVESYANIDPSARNTLGGGMGTYGVAQWRGPRMKALADFAGVDIAELANAPVTTPEGRQYAAIGQGGGFMSTSGQGTTMQEPPRDPDFYERMTGGFLNPDRRDRLIMGLQGMTLNPNQALIQNASANIQDRRETAKQEKIASRTAEWLTGMSQKTGNPVFGQLAQAVGSGVMDGKTAVTMGMRSMAEGSDPSVQSSSMLPDLSGTVMTMRDGSLKVVGVNGETLTGQAAMDFVARANENAARIEKEKYGARVTGTNEAQAATGTAAAAAPALGEQAVKMAGDAWTGYGAMQSSIGTINEALDALDGGARAGAIDRYLPNITEASARLQNAMDRMGLDVISATTFGALSEGELRLAMETAVPRNLNEDDLRVWLTRRRDAQQKAAQMLASAAEFLSKPGNTLNDWVKQNKSGGAPAATSGGEWKDLGGGIKIRELP